MSPPRKPAIEDPEFPGYYRSSGKYWYRMPKSGDVKGNQGSPFDKFICRDCGCSFLRQHNQISKWGNTLCSRCVRKGSNSSRWLYDSTNVITLHSRVYAAKGKAVSCVWGCESKHYQWSCIWGDYTDINDYTSLCIKCHKRYDMAVLSMMRRTWY